jgi:hypothetical protein
VEVGVGGKDRVDLEDGECVEEAVELLEWEELLDTVIVDLELLVVVGEAVVLRVREDVRVDTLVDVTVRVREDVRIAVRDITPWPSSPLR